MSCDNDDKCEYTLGGMTYYNQCQCGYNAAGQSYCPALIGDAPGKSYVKTLASFLNSSGVLAKCNTERRYSAECWRQFENTTIFNTFHIAQSNFRHYPQMLENTECIKQTFTCNYWYCFSTVLLGALVGFLF
jgi:hypothetical protein